MNFLTQSLLIDPTRPIVEMNPQELRRFAATTHIPLFYTFQKSPDISPITRLFCLYEGVQFVARE